MILLKNVIPEPLQDGNKCNGSSVFATDCKFEKGKNYLLTAPSGKGKSTFMHIAYGIRKDYSGDVEINGTNIRKFSNDDWSQLRQEKLSIVFQDLRLFPQLSAFDNIILKNDLTKKFDENEVKDMANKLGMLPYLNQKAETLSYGQRQRIAIIRALCQPFDFLLLDEPFSHLDENNTRIACELIIEKCKHQNASIILVSLGETYFFDYYKHLII